MGLLHLFLAASMAVVKVFLVVSVGFFLALDRVDVLGSTACKLMNKVGISICSLSFFPFISDVKYFLCP